MIVNCAVYTGGRKVADIPLDQAGEWSARDGHFVWIGLFEPPEEEMRLVQAELELHDLAVEDAHRAHQRPKLEEYDDGVFVVLRAAHWNEEKRTIDRGETHVFVGPRYVVSVRHGDTGSYALVRERCELSPEHLALGPGFVLYAIMDFVVDSYFGVIDHFEDRVGKLEEAIFADRSQRDIARRIYDLKRRLIMVKRAVSPLVEVCNRLVRYDSHQLVPDSVRPYFRDVYDHVVRINESMESLRDLLASALDANLAMTSIRQNEVMKQLAGWAAIVAVPTFLAGIWGMNFRDMPELQHPWGYPVALVLMVGVMGFLFSRFKRAGWL
jgi:magnesium transporter